MTEKKGSLHRCLGIPQSERIPRTLENKIMSTEAGEHIRNPTQTGKRIIPVTKKLRQKTNEAINFRKGKRYYV
jgi:hypothetical protein